MQGKFEVYRDNQMAFRFRLLSSSGENLLASEGYKEKRSALNGIASIKKNCQLPERFQRQKSTDGRYYFVLRARNHETIGRSRLFDDDTTRDQAIDVFVQTASAAEIDDLTKRKRQVA